MASNSFGNIFRITTWGESHGKAIGVVIDGCPAGIELSEADIQVGLDARAPGKNAFTSPRQESDRAQIYSGVFEGKTTGAPISIIIPNKDADSSQYENIKNLLRPGHANYTYLQKYGLYDYRGGGRASARETAARVAAAQVAKKILDHYAICVCGFLGAVGDTAINPAVLKKDALKLKQDVGENPIFCPDQQAFNMISENIIAAKNSGDSLGGVVGFIATGLPVGLGEPLYEKLEANLAKAMLSLPATKGFEIGEGFQSTAMLGSQHNDAYENKDGQIKTITNHAGGILAGISNGMPLYGQVAFKPTSSIRLAQQTTDIKGETKTFQLSQQARHDPCVAIRAVPIVEAMCTLVLADFLLMNRAARL